MMKPSKALPINCSTHFVLINGFSLFIEIQLDKTIFFKEQNIFPSRKKLKKILRLLMFILK